MDFQAFLSPVARFRVFFFVLINTNIMEKPIQTIMPIEGKMPKDANCIPWGKGLYLWTHESFSFTSIDEEGQEYTAITYVGVVDTHLGGQSAMVADSILREYLRRYDYLMSLRKNTKVLY